VNWDSENWKTAAREYREQSKQQPDAEINDGEAEDGDEKQQRKTQADILLELAAKATLFCTPDGEGFADITIGDHREAHRICGPAFRRWLRHQYYKVKKRGCNSDALKVAVETLDAKATFEGETRDVHVRIAGHKGNIYIDLGDKGWKAIEVSKTGWSVVADPPVRFARPPSIRSLPIPVKGGSIQLLQPFCNLSSDGFTLFVAVLLAGLRPDSNYPVPVITGEQGCGKSSLVRILTRLIDPRMPEQRSMPRSEEDLLVAAKAQHFLSYDNVSGLPDWLSDAICRLSTGGGAGKRQLYTDTEEVLFAGRRLVALNGIEDVALRPDLVDRAIMLGLEPIPEDERRDEEEYNAAFDRAAPKILGALLDGAVYGLRNLATTHLTNLPRMADFALWVEACTRAYWPANTFLKAYRENIGSAVELTIEASDVAEAVRAFMANQTEWKGTASELLPLLTAIVPERATKEKTWPKQANALSGKLRRVAPPLRKVGISIAFLREAHDRTRLIHIRSTRQPGEKGKTSSASSAMEEKTNKNNGQSADNADDPRATADDVRTLEGMPSSASNPLKTQAADDADGADGLLRSLRGRVPNDVDAVELAARESTSYDPGPIPDCLRRAPLGGNGQSARVPNDYDAVIEELAARGEPTNVFRAPRGTRWHLVGDLPPNQAKARVWIKEVWPPGLGPPSDDVFDIDPRWRQ
jgi:energy-coupling factor transporter ATP-binding protein EcfA2